MNPPPQERQWNQVQATLEKIWWNVSVSLMLALLFVGPVSAALFFVGLHMVAVWLVIVVILPWVLACTLAAIYTVYVLFAGLARQIGSMGDELGPPDGDGGDM